ncbi:MAG: hypothetical protein M0030_01095 [Actinomycetota bacterium]|nr:hypothetical protein [Actinomycetota bacterium]
MNRSDWTILRSLDSADPRLDAGQRQRAADLLETIVATPAGAQAAPRVPARLLRRRTVLASLSASALIAATAAITQMGTTGIAYASWTATPTTVSARSLAAVALACRQNLASYPRSVGGLDFHTWQGIPLTLAERRGSYVLVQLSNRDQSISATCLAVNTPGTGTVTNVQTVFGGGGPAPTPPPGRIFETQVSQLGTPPFSLVDGTVGAGVTGVIIHAGGLTVTATVSHGQYVAWWPGRAFSAGPLPPSGRGGPSEIITYDIRLTNGQTLHHVNPH